MNSVYALAIAVLCIVAGLITFLFPETVSHLQEDAETTPTQAVQQVRIGGAILVLFGWALLYAILTDNGQPVEFIGV